MSKGRERGEEWWGDWGEEDRGRTEGKTEVCCEVVMMLDFIFSRRSSSCRGCRRSEPTHTWPAGSASDAQRVIGCSTFSSGMGSNLQTPHDPHTPGWSSFLTTHTPTEWWWSSMRNLSRNMCCVWSGDDCGSAASAFRSFLHLFLCVLPSCSSSESERGSGRFTCPCVCVKWICELEVYLFLLTVCQMFQVSLPG